MIAYLMHLVWGAPGAPETGFAKATRRRPAATHAPLARPSPSPRPPPYRAPAAPEPAISPQPTPAAQVVTPKRVNTTSQGELRYGAAPDHTSIDAGIKEIVKFLLDQGCSGTCECAPARPGPAPLTYHTHRTPTGQEVGRDQAALPPALIYVATMRSHHA